MRIVTLYNEVPGLKLALLRAVPADQRSEGDFVWTGVRADGEPALPMTGFSQDCHALYDLDVHYGSAFRWLTSSPIGYVSPTERLRLLLGETLTVTHADRTWTIALEL